MKQVYMGIIYCQVTVKPKRGLRQKAQPVYVKSAVEKVYKL